MRLPLYLVAIAALAAPHALAQKQGGVLRTYNSSNPPSASIHEEATIATVMPFSGVFNNLLAFDPSKPRNGRVNVMIDRGPERRCVPCLSLDAHLLTCLLFVLAPADIGAARVVGGVTRYVV